MLWARMLPAILHRPYDPEQAIYGPFTLWGNKKISDMVCGHRFRNHSNDMACGSDFMVHVVFKVRECQCYGPPISLRYIMGYRGASLVLQGFRTKAGVHIAGR